MDPLQLLDPSYLVAGLVLGVVVNLVATMVGVSRGLATVAALAAVLGGASYPGGPGGLVADVIRPLRSLLVSSADRQAARSAAVAEATGEAAPSHRH
jgi:hypothetical protein